MRRDCCCAEVRCHGDRRRDARRCKHSGQAGCGGSCRSLRLRLGIGFVVARKAMDIAIEKAAIYGVGLAAASRDLQRGVRIGYLPSAAPLA